jgi:hypothetical protein
LEAAASLLSSEVSAVEPVLGAVLLPHAESTPKMSTMMLVSTSLFLKPFILFAPFQCGKSCELNYNSDAAFAVESSRGWLCSNNQKAACDRS